MGVVVFLLALFMGEVMSFFISIIFFLTLTNYLVLICFSRSWSNCSSYKTQHLTYRKPPEYCMLWFQMAIFTQLQRDVVYFSDFWFLIDPVISQSQWKRLLRHNLTGSSRQDKKKQNNVDKIFYCSTLETSLHLYYKTNKIHNFTLKMMFLTRTFGCRVFILFVIKKKILEMTV